MVENQQSIHTSDILGKGATLNNPVIEGPRNHDEKYDTSYT